MNDSIKYSEIAKMISRELDFRIDGDRVLTHQEIGEISRIILSSIAGWSEIDPKAAGMVAQIERLMPWLARGAN
jgi:hypothetical protein